MIQVVPAVIAVGLLSLGAFAQSQQPSAPATGCDVAAELRLLRASIDASGKAQVLSASAAMQQARIEPLMAELLATRKQLEEVQVSLREASMHLQDFRPSGDSSRDEIIQAQLSGGLKTIERKEAMLRAREGDLSTRLQNEEAVWQQLMAQLQQTIKR